VPVPLPDCITTTHTSDLFTFTIEAFLLPKAFLLPMAVLLNEGFVFGHAHGHEGGEPLWVKGFVSGTGKRRFN
jgi:hypothetical protein